MINLSIRPNPTLSQLLLQQLLGHRLNCVEEDWFSVLNDEVYTHLCIPVNLSRLIYYLKRVNSQSCTS